MENIASFLPLILLFVVFYFLLIRPQQKQQKKRQEMLNNLEEGNRVVTIGGLHGVIKKIDEDVIALRVAEGLTLKFSRAAVERVLDDEEE
ncbi:MAG: preprotein translocase subunit YajC [Bacillota bacterium]